MLESMPRRILKLAEYLGLALLIPLVTSAATGCLYLLHVHVLHGWGPRADNILLLDQIAHQASAPIVFYVASYLLAGVLLGMACHAAGMNRVSAGLVLMAGVSAWMYLVDAFSLFVVLQISFDASLRRAASLQSIYVAGVTAGLAGALLGRRPLPGQRLVSATVFAVALGGMFDLLAAVFPRHRIGNGVIGAMTTSFLPPTAAALIVPVGILLLIAARGLSRRRRSAWKIAIGLLGLSTLLSLAQGFNYLDAVVSGAVALLLVAARHEFTAESPSEARTQALVVLGSLVAVAYAFACAALVVNRLGADLPVHPLALAQQAGRALIGLAPQGRAYLPDRFGVWFPWAVVGIEAVGAAWAAAIWLAPWRQRFSFDQRRHNEAVDLVRRFGADTLSPFALRHDKELFFFYGDASHSDVQEAAVLIAYRVVRGVALIASDPIGPQELIEPSLRAFLEMSHKRGWRTAILGSSSNLLELYGRLGMRSIYHGDEAILDVKTFTLEGPPMRTVRQAVHRVERHGYRAEVVFAGAVTPPLWEELRTVEATWLAGRARTGFVMQLDDLARLGSNDAVFVVARGARGEIGGFVHLVVCHSSRMLSLSSMPWRPDSPNGINAWLIHQAASWAQAQDFAAISLNFSPFAGLLESDAELTGVRKLERRALMRMKQSLSLQLDNLLLFNRRFAPRWEPRFVVFERLGDLPRVALAAMAAEGYLPFAARLRGTDWVPRGLSPEAGPFGQTTIDREKK